MSQWQTIWASASITHDRSLSMSVGFKYYITNMLQFSNIHHYIILH